MSTASTAAFGGVLVAGAVAAADTMHRISDRSRDARDDAQDASREAATANTKINNLLDGGDMQRLRDPRVRDFMLGLSYPVLAALVSPSAFGAPATIIERPAIEEERAVANPQYPGAVNQYNGDGLLRDPTAYLTAQNTKLGLAMGYAEIVNFLCGLAIAGQPSTADQAQMFRAARGLSVVSRELGSLDEPLTLEQHKAAWRRFYNVGSTPGAYGNGVFWSMIESGPTKSNSSSVEELASAPFPANLLAVGETVQYRFQGTGETDNGTVGFSIRLDSTGGTAWFTGESTAVTATPFGWYANLYITRRPDAGGAQVFAISCDGAVEASENTVGTTTATRSLDHSIDHNFLMCSGWSAADTDDKTTCTFGFANKLGGPVRA